MVRIGSVVGMVGYPPTPSVLQTDASSKLASFP